ncbi:transposase [Paenibacillus thiaminolyticus]|uniref:transposase n=1 Tax=Paenibacillus thiaminolyticus TaxID=49283 RepID=UPI0025435A87|nr:transposase [Paenibacillus thiaminolyticus]WII39754.1 transposase [Paenibacillus thiaminolyticus]
MKYPSDLTTKQWNIIKSLFEREKRGKHFQVHSKRNLVNAVLYINKTGCPWRQLPHDFPKYTTVSSFYQRAVKNGLWAKVLKKLVQKTRTEAGRNAEPSYALIDSQSVKTTPGAEDRGVVGGKKQKVANVIL